MTKTIRNLVMALVLAAGTGVALSGPALADDWHHGNDRGREWRAHDWRGPAWRAHYPVYAPAPRPYVVPSYGYYVPPPVAYAQPGASFSLTVPFSIR